MPNSLTEEEETDWCKNKQDYKYLLKIPHNDRTEAENDRLRRMAEEYRDWHRYHDIKKGRLTFNPKIHTSKIFADIPGYTGGE